MPRFEPSPRSTRALLWTVGALALVAGTAGWVVPARPYEAPWAWISFVGMCIIDDYLLGSDSDAECGQLPKVTMFAAIIVFRRHPEVTMLVALLSAPLASVLKRQRAATEVTVTAQWVVAAVVGAAVFRAVGFEDPAHFVVATLALIVVYYLLGPLLGAWLEARLSSIDVRAAFLSQRRFAVSGELAGVLLAMAWRTAAFQPAALKVADGALVAVVGILAAFSLDGRPAWVFRSVGRIPERPALVGAVLLLAGLLLPSPLSWLLPLGLSLAAGTWAARRQAFSVLCCALGAFCNELVRAFNHGLMPVEGPGLMSGLGAANTYATAGPHTMLAFLDDRFHLPPPFPGIASAGDILIAVGMAWLVATVTVRRRQRSVGPVQGEPAVENAA